MPKRLLIPGLGGSERGHWQQWWLTRDPDASIVEQEDWVNPDVDLWSDRVAASVAESPGAILVGHSLGATLIPHLVRAYPQLNIRAALIVAPADADESPTLREIARGFAPIPRDRLPFPSILVGSTNDPYLRIQRAMRLATDWGSRLFHAGASGHINTASGHGQWPGGLQLAAQLLESAPQTPRFSRFTYTQERTRPHLRPLNRQAANRTAP